MMLSSYLTKEYSFVRVYRIQDKSYYGYMKDADNSEQWIKDEEAAQVVKRIFALCMDGNGPTQIARILKEEQVLTPTVYQDKQKRKVRCALPDNPYGWNGSMFRSVCCTIPAPTI